MGNNGRLTTKKKKSKVLIEVLKENLPNPCVQAYVLIELFILLYGNQFGENW